MEAAIIRPKLLILLALIVLCPGMFAAQTLGADNAVQIGDQWIYNTRDEVTGTVTRTYVATVSEISPTEIVTQVTNRGGKGGAVVAFDHDWNRVANGVWRYKPNDAQGVRLPLAVGREWRAEFISSNAQSGASFKSSTLAKVTAQESLTTPAGTFDTFKIERQVKGFNTADPSRSTETTYLMWFAPQINHWARRTIITKVDKRIRSNETDELIEYTLKQ
jgi:hypothetical protein